MNANELVQIIAATAMLLSVIAVIINRWQTKRGIGVRSVQFVAACSIVPGTVILAMSDKIGGETSAALIGAFVGYLFANIANFDKDKSD